MREFWENYQIKIVPWILLTPALIMFSGTALVIFMMTVVVPQFEAVYSESATQLPWVTRVVSAASRGTCPSALLKAARSIIAHMPVC